MHSDTATAMPMFRRGRLHVSSSRECGLRQQGKVTSRNGGAGYCHPRGHIFAPSIRARSWSHACHAAFSITCNRIERGSTESQCPFPIQACPKADRAGSREDPPCRTMHDKAAPGSDLIVTALVTYFRVLPFHQATRLVSITCSVARPAPADEMDPCMPPEAAAIMPSTSAAKSQ